eukprot:jgi/Psemu1/9939/gm1.9939_g
MATVRAATLTGNSKQQTANSKQQTANSNSKQQQQTATANSNSKQQQQTATANSNSKQQQQTANSNSKQQQQTANSKQQTATANSKQQTATATTNSNNKQQTATTTTNRNNKQKQQTETTNRNNKQHVAPTFSNVRVTIGGTQGESWKQAQLEIEDVQAMIKELGWNYSFFSRFLITSAFQNVMNISSSTLYSPSNAGRIPKEMLMNKSEFGLAWNAIGELDLPGMGKPENLSLDVGKIYFWKKLQDAFNHLYHELFVRKLHPFPSVTPALKGKLKQSVDGDEFSFSEDEDEDGVDLRDSLDRLTLKCTLWLLTRRRKGPVMHQVVKAASGVIFGFYFERGGGSERMATTNLLKGHFASMVGEDHTHVTSLEGFEIGGNRAYNKKAANVKHGDPRTDLNKEEATILFVKVMRIEDRDAYTHAYRNGYGGIVTAITTRYPDFEWGSILKNSADLEWYKQHCNWEKREMEGNANMDDSDAYNRDKIAESKLRLSFKTVLHAVQNKRDNARPKPLVASIQYHGARITGLIFPSGILLYIKNYVEYAANHVQGTASATASASTASTASTATATATASSTAIDTAAITSTQDTSDTFNQLEFFAWMQAYYFDKDTLMSKYATIPSNYKHVAESKTPTIIQLCNRLEIYYSNQLPDEEWVQLQVSIKQMPSRKGRKEGCKLAEDLPFDNWMTSSMLQSTFMRRLEGDDFAHIKFYEMTHAPLVSWNDGFKSQTRFLVKASADFICRCVNHGSSDDSSDSSSSSSSDNSMNRSSSFHVLKHDDQDLKYSVHNRSELLQILHCATVNGYSCWTVAIGNSKADVIACILMQLVIKYTEQKASDAEIKILEDTASTVQLNQFSTLDLYSLKQYWNLYQNCVTSLVSPLPPCARLVPKVIAFWNANKSGSDTQSKLMSHVECNSSSKYIQSNVALQLSNGFTSVHQMFQVATAKEAIYKKYLSLWYYQNAANQQSSYKNTLLLVSNNLSSWVGSASAAVPMAATRLPTNHTIPNSDLDQDHHIPECQATRSLYLQEEAGSDVTGKMPK